jgi:hypothetical protein
MSHNEAWQAIRVDRGCFECGFSGFPRVNPWRANPSSPAREPRVSGLRQERTKKTRHVCLGDGSEQFTNGKSSHKSSEKKTHWTENIEIRGSRISQTLDEEWKCVKSVLSYLESKSFHLLLPGQRSRVRRDKKRVADGRRKRFRIVESAEHLYCLSDYRIAFVFSSLLSSAERFLFSPFVSPSFLWSDFWSASSRSRWCPHQQVRIVSIARLFIVSQCSKFPIFLAFLFTTDVCAVFAGSALLLSLTPSSRSSVESRQKWRSNWNWLLCSPRL